MRFPIRQACAWVFASLLSTAVPASAGNPLLVDPASAVPYTWQDPVGGPPAAFYNLDPGPLNATMDHAAARATVVAAFDAWESIPTAAITYTDRGDLAFDVNGANASSVLFTADGQSPIVFDPDGTVLEWLGMDPDFVLAAAGIEVTYAPGHAIRESFAVVGGKKVTGDPRTGYTLQDLTGILVHELGHFSNLDHSVVNGDAIFLGDATGPSPFDTFGRPPDSSLETMYPFTDQAHAAFLTTPHADDVAILSTLYPDGGFPTAAGTLSGRILDADGATGLTGVNVVARNPNDPFEDAVSAISGNFTIGQGPLGPFDGRFTLNGLTPGAGYAVYTDEIRRGEFSTPLRTVWASAAPILAPFPGPEELYNGAAESAVASVDDPAVYTLVTAAPSTPSVDILFNRTADYPAATDPNTHRFEGGTRDAPTFPDGTPVEIGPGEIHRLRFRPPALLDKASRMLLRLKAGSPSIWNLALEAVHQDGSRTISPLAHGQGVWRIEHDLGVTAGAPGATEVREINLLVRHTAGSRKTYSFEADIVPQIRSVYTPDPASGTTATVKNLLPSATVHPGTVVQFETIFSAPVTTLEADLSAVDPAFNPAAVKVTGPVSGPSGTAYRVSYPLSYSASPAGAVTLRASTTLARQTFSSVDSSFHLSLGGDWTYLWDAGQLPTQAGWVLSDIGRPQPQEDVNAPGIYHVRLDGVDARLYYAFRASYLRQVPLTVEMRLRNAVTANGTGTIVSGYAGASERFVLGFVLSNLAGTVDKVGLDYVQEPFPPDQYNNIFLDTKDGFHVYRVTVDGARTVRLYVDGVLRLQAQAGTSASLEEFGFGFFYFYEGFWDYVAIKAGAALDPSALPSPPTAP